MRIVLASWVARIGKSGAAFRSGGARSFALLWLTGRKRPGKICRRAAVLPLPRAGRLPVQQRLLNEINGVRPWNIMARGSHCECRDCRHGSVAGLDSEYLSGEPEGAKRYV